MAVQAPFHPDTSFPKRGDAAGHEPLDDVLEEEGSSKTQRLIGWVCGLLTVAALVAAWRLF